MAQGNLPVDFKEEFLHCKVCFEWFQEPKSLPCTHTFCLKCLEKTVKATKATASFPCPLCREDVEIPQGGLENLPTHYLMNSMLDYAPPTTDNPEKVEPETFVKCDNCETHKATVKCAVCGILCVSCSDKIHQEKVLKQHTISNFDGVVEKTEPKSEISPKWMCKKHNERLVFYCTQDEVPICFYCKLSSHEGHSTEDLDTVGLKCQQEMESFATILDEYKGRAEKQKTETSAYKEEFLVNKKVVQDVVQQHAETLKDAIDNCAGHLIKELDDICVGEEKRINVRLDEATIAHHRSEIQYQQVQNLIENGQPVELVQCAKELRLLLSPDSSEAYTVPELEYKLEVSFNSTDINQIQNDMNGLFGVLVQNKQQIEPEVLVKKPERTSLIEKIFSSFRIKPKQSEIKAHPPTGQSRKRASRLSDINIVSNFDTKTDQDLEKIIITGIATNSKNEIIVVDYQNKNVKIFRSSGEWVRVFGNSVLKLPWDVDILDNDSMVVTDRRDQDIKVFMSDGGLKTCISGSHFKDPCGVAISSNKETILIGDTGAKCIFILDNSGNLLKTYKNRLVQAPFYLTKMKSSGNIIVSDTEFNGVLLLNADGGSLCKYGGIPKGSGHAQFNGPCGVCVDESSCIFVVDYENNRVHVIDQEARFIGFLSQEIELPYAITIDGKGQLVIAEQTGYVKIFKFSE